MPAPKLSVLVPAYNEEATILQLIGKVIATELVGNHDKEIIIVDDCSTDRTGEIVAEYIENHPGAAIFYFRQPKNMGKGAAIHKAIELARGEYIVIQDADLEYDPADYNRLLHPLISGAADVVYGSRFVGANPHRALFFWHMMGNRFLTFMSNLFTNLNLTDMETCYKVFRADVIKPIRLQEKRFGFEPEVTAKISRIPGVRIYEVGISYYGRTYGEGKKIGISDGFRAIYCILKYNLFGGKAFK